MDNLIPFELEVYTALLMNHLEEEKQRIQAATS